MLAKSRKTRRANHSLSPWACVAKQADTRSGSGGSGTPETGAAAMRLLACSELPIAPQNLLAVCGRVSVAPHADIDIASAGVLPALDVYADARAPVQPVAVRVPATVHVDIDVATLLRTARPL